MTGLVPPCDWHFQSQGKTGLVITEGILKNIVMLNSTINEQFQFGKLIQVAT